MEITLTDEERDLLSRLLEAEVRDMRSAHYHAESHDVKEAIHAQEECARRLLERLKRREQKTAEGPVGTA